MEKEKDNKGLIIVIILLIIFIAALVTYIIVDKTKAKKDDTNNPPITTITNNNKEENILKEESMVYELNNEEQKITYQYTIMDSTTYYDKNPELKDTDEYVYNVVNLKILVNDNKVEDIELPLYFDYSNTTKEKLISKIDQLSSSTINKITGKDDKEYLVITIKYKSQEYDEPLDIIILDTKGSLLYNLEIDEQTSWTITDSSAELYQKGDYAIVDNKLYYLKPNCDKTKDGIEYANEYVIEVNNGKATNKIVGTYQAQGAGAKIC